MQDRTARRSPLAQALPLAALGAFVTLTPSVFAQGGPGPGAPPGPPLPPVPVPAGNPITPAKAVLGKILFWEEQLSSDNTTACATCHIPSAQGGDPRTGQPGSRHPGADGLLLTADDVFGSPGVVRADASDDYMESDFGFDTQVTGRTAPTMIAAAFFNSMFWDGRATSQFLDPETGLVSLPNGAALESQAAGPPLSDVEMAHEARDWSAIAAKLEDAKPLALASNLTPDIVTALLASPDYPSLFMTAFGSTDITADRISRAIATYERTLVPDQTDFDAFVAGNPAALTPQERQGFNTFSGPGRCRVCHVPPLFSDGTFRNIGVRPPAEDLGRQDVTGNPGDRGRFKVPTLRNVALRSRFFHNGQEGSLATVLGFYARGGDFADNRDPVMNLINLSPPQRADIVAFLTGALTDPRVANELPPFDRPTLHSETPAATPGFVERGVSGTAGVPQMIATAPSALGTEGFKLGLAGALGGSQAILVLTDPATGGPYSETRGGSVMRLGSLARMPQYRLPGSGPSDGFTTYHLELPPNAGLIGQVIHAQWWIADPMAVGGFAKTEKVALTLF